ncbi:MAG TPA: hypothetical protein VE865_11890, partial [Bradyrhizobium sp.]|nr:hypothetical protein [Bradyrhizobium sp.]
MTSASGSGLPTGNWSVAFAVMYGSSSLGKLFFAAGDRVHPDVVTVSREVDQASVIRVIGHPVAELLFSLGGRAPDRLPKLAEHRLHAFGSGGDVGVDGLLSGCF